MAIDDMLGDGDGTIRFQELNYSNSESYALQYYHYWWSKDINDYPQSDYVIRLMSQSDLNKLGSFMYKLKDIKVFGRALRDTICSEDDDEAPYGIDYTNGGDGPRRLQNLPTVIDANGNFVRGNPYSGDYFLKNHAQYSSFIENDDTYPTFSTSPQCDYLDPRPDNNVEGECELWQGGAYTTANFSGAISSLTFLYNFFDGDDPTSDTFLGYGFIEGPIRLKLEGRYYPHPQNCIEEIERRTDYLTIGNVLRRPEAGGNGHWTPGSVTHSTGTETINGVTFAKIISRSTVIGAGSGGYVRNDYTGEWVSPYIGNISYYI
jgi:hypothetical protein